MTLLQTTLFSYLLNSLWQVPLIFAAAWLAARLARRAGPNLEHRIWTSALVLEATLPAVPAHTLPACWQFLAHVWHHTIAPASAHISITTTTTYGRSSLHLPAPLLTLFAAAYSAALLYAIGRLTYSLFETRQLRRSAQPVALTAEALHTWQRCATLFRVPNAQVATSSLIAAPGTIGIRRRLVLLPSTLPAGLPSDHLAAALAHEFAHMHRRDFALNLLYQLLALPIAWHPILWLTSARIAETREILCDALAAQSLPGTQPTADYARSLLRLASLLLPGAPTPTPHAIGIFDANIFERRLMHLTTKSIELRGVRRLATIAVCTLLGLGACTSALALHIPAPTPTAQEPAAPSTPHIAGGIIAANRISFVNPVYPPDAKAAKLSGTVILHAIIGKDGAIESLSVVSGPEALQKSALDAVHHWTYKPYLLNGEPTAVETTITINYSLSE